MVIKQTRINSKIREELYFTTDMNTEPSLILLSRAVDQKKTIILSNINRSPNGQINISILKQQHINSRDIMKILTPHSEDER
ncbi:hypothetical protein GJ496_007120 [Pomphorhynchus laevis]|nr:hypothetical protein GJ496_007120 [Pomphorhynchus laevis]